MFKPKFFSVLSEITPQQFSRDLNAGILVGIVALPLAIAFAIASGVSPEKGLITAVIGGFLVSFLGGSRVQIGGPTGAFIVILYGIVEQYGVNGLMIATMMAGFILMLMGFAQFGSLIKFIPYPVVVGFTSGIAVIIFSSQISDFLGLSIEKVPADFIEKWITYATHLTSINPESFLIGMLSLIIIIFWPKISRKIPGSIISLIAATLIVKFAGLDVATIESRFGEIPSTIPAPSIPVFDFATVKELIMPATTIALLGAIEALLSAVVSDGMIGSRHKSNMELVAQGAANIITPLFGGIPVTGAIARTATNVKNGGRTPVAGMVHAITLLAIMLLFGGWAKLIPMPTLAAILIVVAWNMSEHRVFRQLLKSPRGDVIVLLTTFGLTVVFDLTIAIEIGMLLAVLLFMQHMAGITNIGMVTGELKDREEEDDPNTIRTRSIPDGVEVFEISGAMFFGAASKFKDAMHIVEKKPLIRIIRMRKVLSIDATGLNMLRELLVDSRKTGIQLVLSGVHAHPLFAMQQYGIYDEIGEENIFGNIDDALDRSRELLGLPKTGRTENFVPSVEREK
ncbi:MAG: STAS domain-containing protein [Chlorobium sp.]|uniref:SulP family inorganic anion transporter n=1 Tax=Chlorobium sp. TaxID=1095 RepID=UPI0025B7D387|nr:SulP family inorganic anion transporter [Chlorobium sp.]MCF8216492.1 STAS domain-containing protein [Chlorobium sp.]MCF8271397.1 STAS domain-containing protein [Chlorobium sp.]MCF8287769.1 STAS domain-containing protein [Chlorobium sp.]MCF8291308.1 STAS domain-containing protein [Chlorobium sp.]MCF8385403.1 STAS domain-containing protein [Chlorobium sp.]